MTARRVVVLLVVLVVFYTAFIGWRGVALVADGRPVFVALGIGVLLMPVAGLVLVWREVVFGRDAERLGRRLGDEGGLPVYELPRRASGRVDRSAVDEVFDRYRVETEAAPDDWRTWYRLGVAYGDAGDTARGRGAVRHAIRLEQRDRAAGG